MSVPKKKLPEYAIKNENGYTLYRDDMAMQTPRALSLTVPQQKLAEALLHECLSQKEDRLDLRTMPMTQMTLTVIDIASTQRTNICEGIMRYGDSELLCQRALDPADLLEEQNNIWQPYIDWCSNRYKVSFVTGSGVVPFSQNVESLAVLRREVEKLDDYALVGLSEAVGVSGSLVLGLALITKHASPQQVFEACELDSLWQMRKWGEDPVTIGRHSDILRDLNDCARWFDLVSA